MDYSQQRVTVPDPSTSKPDANKTPSVDAPLSLVVNRYCEYIAAIEECERMRVLFDNAVRSYFKARQDSTEAVEDMVQSIAEARQRASEGVL